MGAVILGIDSGTQNTKAILVDAETGQVRSIGPAPHVLIAATPGQKEQHPQWWVEALTRAVQEVPVSTPEVEVLGIGVSGQQHGLVMLDGSDAVLRPAKLWNDVTCAPQCERLMDRLGGWNATIRLIGNTILPGYTAGKVLWVHKDEPEIYARGRWILLPHDFLNPWLTGGMNYSVASRII
jgi:xylulokinase